jgi:hypothetical protein
MTKLANHLDSSAYTFPVGMAQRENPLPLISPKCICGLPGKQRTNRNEEIPSIQDLWIIRLAIIQGAK